MKIQLKNSRWIGQGEPTYIVAEIGINHNGSMVVCEELLIHARDAGADAVKFQMRTVDEVYSPEELARPRKSPFGDTNGDLKRGLEFSVEQYRLIDAMCKRLGLDWSASCWDVASLERLRQFEPPWYKIAGPCLTDPYQLHELRLLETPVFLSSGMSTSHELVTAAVRLGALEYVPMHCVSSYPTRPADANLRAIPRLIDEFGIAGYSGHELGIGISIAAVALGACVVERHLTASRKLWGSDQAVSLEPLEFAAMVKGIREVELALSGDGERRLYDCERSAWEKLRRYKGKQEVTNGA